MKHIFFNRSSKKGALEIRLILLMLLLIIGLPLLLLQAPHRISAMEASKQYDEEFYEFADLFVDVYKSIRERYVDETVPKDLFEGAINGMFATLDDHSSYLPPESAQTMERETEGEYSGVGLHISLDKDRILTVVAPIPGSPAAQAGVTSWDRIIEINDETTRDITLRDAMKKLLGPSGSTVKIKVWRDGESKPLDFELKRERIHVNNVFSKAIDDGKIGYIRIANFQEDTGKAARAELEKFNKQGAIGVILDLRNNTGGLLPQAIEVSELFLPKGQLIVSTKGRNASDNREFFSQKDPVCVQSLVILVNEGSASASEIVAGAVKDTDRGVIMGPEGKHTYGKGSVQTLSVLPVSLERDENGSMLPSSIRLTTARYYTPSGESIHKKGIIPDIGVPLPENHEIELMRRGLLGDPDMIEPGTEDDLTSLTMRLEHGSIDPSTQTKTRDENASKTLEQLLQNRSSQKATEGNATKTDVPFRDIMLDEAIKYLQTHQMPQHLRKTA